MKAILNLDQDADASTLPPEYVSKIKFRVEGNRPTPTPYFAKGTEFEGAHAVQLVKTGQASPADEECAKACGLTPAQIVTNSRQYLAAMKGIRGDKDMAMFMAGAIEGYAPESTDDNTVYIPGPNWDSWKAAEQERKAKLKKDVI